jgi:hypothetical protein
MTISRQIEWSAHLNESDPNISVMRGEIDISMDENLNSMHQLLIFMFQGPDLDLSKDVHNKQH